MEFRADILDNVVGKNNRYYFMGISIIAVILYHFFLWSESILHYLSYLSRFASRGFYGVDVFLFLSAFGLCHSFKNVETKITSFYIRRIKKLFPLYIIFCLLCIYLFGVCSYGQSIIAFCGLSVFNFSGVYIEWYIPFLMFIYFIFPFLYKLFYKISLWSFKKEMLVFMVVIIISYLLKAFINGADRIPIVVTGIFVYLHCKDIKRLFRILLLGAACSFFLTTQYLLIPFILLAIAMCNFNRYPFFKIFSYIGKYTLEIYLAQTIVLKYWMHDTILNYEWNEFLLFLSCMCLIALLSVVFHCLQAWFYKLPFFK